MKKVLIVINNLEIGGVQQSLLNLLEEINNKYDITLLIFFYKDEYLKIIPKNVKILKLDSYFKYFGMSQKEIKKNSLDYMVRMFLVVITKLINRSMAIKIISKLTPKIQGYDYAISFLHEGSQKIFYGGCNEFVLKNVNSVQKITWLHCDFKLCGANSLQNIKIYRKFDKIVACSEGTKNIFLECVPDLKSKCLVIENCNNYKKLKKLALYSKTYKKNFFNIVSVARLSQEKGIERGIYAVKECIDNGFLVQYHIIGFGNQENILKKLAKDLGIEENIIFYGKQQNPYQYIKNADLFLITSYHEAAPMVINEAASLGIPILSTKTISAEEMIIKENLGYVCENNQRSISEKLLYILNNQEELKNIKNMLKNKRFSNEKIVEKLNQLINENMKRRLI